MKVSMTCVFGALVLMAGVASAAEDQGFYIQFDAGYSMAADANIKDASPAGTDGPLVVNKLDDVGEAVIYSGIVGYQFNKFFRTDLSYTYRDGFELDDRDDTGDPNTTYDFKGDITSHNVMVNAYAQMPVWFLTPYVGVGAGWAQNKVESVSSKLVGQAVSGKTPSSDATDEFAWQVMVGTGITLTKHISLDLGYRYADLGKLKIDRANSSFTGTPNPTYNLNAAQGDLETHEVKFGIRYLF